MNTMPVQKIAPEIQEIVPGVLCWRFARNEHGFQLGLVIGLGTLMPDQRGVFSTDPTWFVLWNNGEFYEVNSSFLKAHLYDGFEYVET